MSAWMAASLAMVAALAVCVAAACRGAPGARLVAYQLTCAVATLLFALASFAFDQPSSIDLALALAVLGLPGSLLFATFVERWL